MIFDDYDEQWYPGIDGVYVFRTFALLLRKIPGKPPTRKNWPDRGSNPGPLGERQRYYPSTTAGVPSLRHGGGRNEVWVGFSRGFSRFGLPQISFHHFSTFISFISFHFIRPCDGVSCFVGRHPYLQTFNKGASSHHILQPRPCVGHELSIF